MSTTSGLLNTRRFVPLFITQFAGALNDNVLKNAMVVLLTFQASAWTTLAPELLANLAAGIFILPFFLFSATAGQLADKYDRALIARWVKLLEIVIVLVAALGFWRHQIEILLGSLFLLGLHSTLFGPVKYAILPQHLQPHELVGGNALIEASTFVAILLGTIIGGLLVGNHASYAWIIGVGLTIAVAGYLASRKIPSASAPVPSLKINPNPFTETWRNLGFARESRTVFLSIVGISWFWLFGALFLTQFPAYTKNVLGGSETAVTLLLATFTLGIGLGSMLCEKLSGGRVEIGLVPFGSLGMAVFAFDLAWASPALPAPEALGALALLQVPGTLRVLFDLLMLGMFGGFFIVPLYALVQQRAKPEQRARIIAANNIMNALFMVVGTLAAAGFLAAGLSIPQLFAVAALCHTVVALFIYSLVPEFLLRFIVWLLVHSIYRLRIHKLGQIPERGAALLVCNHVSYVDALVIMAASPRPIRFVMDHRIFQWPILSFAFRHSKAIPIASARDNAALMEQAFENISQALQAGDLVGVFPEGKITADGQLNPFRPGIRRVLDRNPVPVIPLALRGLWGSLFSRKHGAWVQRLINNRLFASIELVVGRAVTPNQATPEHLQEEVAALRGTRT